MKVQRKSVVIDLLDDGTYLFRLMENDPLTGRQLLLQTVSGGLTRVIKLAKEELALDRSEAPGDSHKTT